MMDTAYQHPELILATVFLLGMAAGLLLAVWIIHLCCIIGKHLERRNCAIRQQAALSALEVGAIEIDDDRMLCALCWEARHPGMTWGLGRRSLCMEHLLSLSEQEHRQDYVLEPL